MKGAESSSKNMTGWVFIICGVLLIGIGTVSLGYGWFVMRGDQSLAATDQVLRNRQATGAIKRLLEDFPGHLKTVLAQHRKDIDQIAQRHVYRNTYANGPHIREQYELARKKRRGVSADWIELKRKIEDQILAHGQKGLSGEDKIQIASLEVAQEQTRKELLETTHEYFSSRSSTFAVPELEKLKQIIINDEPIE